MENQYLANEEVNVGVSPLNKMMLLLIGGGIGAAAALLLAPKSGHELRGDIAGLMDKGYDRALVAASDMKEKTSEFYEAAKGTGEDVLHVVYSGLSVIKDEVRDDVAKIGSIVQSSALCGVKEDSPIRYRLTELGEKFY